MSDERRIEERRERFIDAFNRAGVDAMAELCADDLVGMPPNEPAIQGLDASRIWWERGFTRGRSTFEAEPVELEVSGDWAFDRFHWTMTVEPAEGGNAVRDRGKCVWMWRRDASGPWPLARAIWKSDLERAGLSAGGAG